MNIFDSQENILKFEDRFLKFGIPSSQYDFVFSDDRNDFAFLAWEDEEYDFYGLESFRNAKSTNENCLYGNNESSNDDMVPLLTLFVEGWLDVKSLQRLVNYEIRKKGYNATVLECLDMWWDEQSDEDSGDIIRKKQPKSRAQIKALKFEYKKKQKWNKKWIKNIAKKLELTEYQVYKWHWDHSKMKNKKSSLRNKKNKRTKACK